ncbi:MAG: hypothetical protein ACOX4L_02045 [Bacillota bacterium]
MDSLSGNTGKSLPFVTLSSPVFPNPLNTSCLIVIVISCFGKGDLIISYNYLKAFEGKVVRLYQGPKYFTGKILGVQEEYLILYPQTKDLMLIKADHIHSIGIDVKDNYLFPVSEDNIGISFAKEKSFYQILQTLKYEMVKFNNGPESVTGIISDVGDENIILVDKQEVWTIYIYHIKSISIDRNTTNNLNYRSLKENKLSNLINYIPENRSNQKQESQHHENNKQDSEKKQFTGTTINYRFL